MLRLYGLESARLLAQASISSSLEDEFSWKPLEKFALALTLAAEVTGDPCFGLKYGTTARFANPLGYLMASAPDLRTALKSFIHYHRVFNTNVASFIEGPGAARVEWSYPVTMSNVAQLTDFVLMRFICRIQSAAGPTWRPLSVSVTHQHPTDREEYERRLGSRITFNQHSNSIVIAGPTLNLLMPSADPHLFKLVRRFCEQEVAHRSLKKTRLIGFATRCFAASNGAARAPNAWRTRWEYPRGACIAASNPSAPRSSACSTTPVAA